MTCVHSTKRPPTIDVFGDGGICVSGSASLEKFITHLLKEMGSVVLMVDCDAKSTSKVLLDLHTIRAMAPHIHPNCEPSLLGQSQSDVKNA